MEKSQPPSYSAGYSPAQVYQPEQPQQATVIIQTTASSNLVAIGSSPTRMNCPSCQAEILTSVKHTANAKTHILALILCLFICWPCVCVPYCMDSCQSAKHYCPNCDAYIGTSD